MDFMMLPPVINNTDTMQGIYKELDRGDLIQVSNRQYVVGKTEEVYSQKVEIDLDKKTIFIRRDK